MLQSSESFSRIRQPILCNGKLCWNLFFFHRIRKMFASFLYNTHLVQNRTHDQTKYQNEPIKWKPKISSKIELIKPQINGKFYVLMPKKGSNISTIMVIVSTGSNAYRRHREILRFFSIIVNEEYCKIIQFSFNWRNIISRPSRSQLVPALRFSLDFT